MLWPLLLAHSETVLTPLKEAFPEPCPPAPTVPQPAGLLPSSSLPLSHLHAAGIEIGEAAHWGAVPPDRSPQPVRRFGTCTAALDALADWLLDCGITTVARESPGVSWIPVFALLEARGLQGMRIDPRQAKRAPGRPTTDRRNGPWLQRLHAYGLLAAAFRPAAQVCVLRRSLRHRQRRLTYGAHQIPPRPKALQQRHRTRAQVVSDRTGATGMAMLRALSAGERDPLPLATLRHPPCPHREDEIAKARQGPWRAEPLCALQPAVALAPCSHPQLTVGDHHLQAHLGTCADTRDGPPLPPKPRRHKTANAPRFDARTPLSHLAGVDLTTIEGIAEGTAWVILAERGTDMSRWPRGKHLCRGRGLSPPPTISGGKGLSRRVRPGAHRVAGALRLAARTVHHARTAVGAF